MVVAQSSDQPLTIALFSDSALPVLNGVSISVHTLMRELRNQGHSVHLFAPAFWNHVDEDPNTYRFISMQTPWTEGYPIALPPYSWWFPRFSQINPMVVHTHTPFASGLVGLQWARLAGVPVVTTYHTHYDRYAHYVPLLPKRYVRRSMWRHTNRYYNRVDHVITPSESSRRWLKHHRIRTPISVIPSGIKPAAVIDRHEVRASLGIPKDATVLLYAGRLAKEKNLETLIEAAAKVMAKRPEVVLWLVGDGPHRPICAQLASQLGIESKVRFVGFVPSDQMGSYYGSADMFVFASTTETQGLVVVEAMNYGLPCIVVRGGGASSAIQHGVDGLLVSNSAESIGTEILRLLSNPEMVARMSLEAKKTAKGYSVEAMAASVSQVYRSVISDGRASPSPALR